jgi:hypothetical protein
MMTDSFNRYCSSSLLNEYLDMFWISVEFCKFMSVATLVSFSVPDSRKEEDAGHEGSVSLLFSSHELYFSFSFPIGRK